jgi:MFS family permease
MKAIRRLFSDSNDTRVPQALVYSTWDGVLWAAMFGLSEHYIVPFALLLGASALQVGLIQGAAQFATAAAQLSGVRLMRHFRRRKLQILIAVGVHGVSWAALIGLSLATRNPWTILACFALGIFATNFGGPAWFSWLRDLVPSSIRGTYWGIRNRYAGIAQFASISTAGFLLSLSSAGGLALPAFVLLFAAAALIRLACLYPLWKEYEPPMSEASFRERLKLGVFLRGLGTTDFGRFCLFIFCLIFGVNICGPYFGVFLIKGLGFGYTGFMLVTMSFMVISFFAMGYWGRIADRYGTRAIMVAAGLGIPLVALGVVFFKSLPGLMLLQIISGFVWAGFNLAASNFVFEAVRREHVPDAWAYYNSTLNLAAFLGTLCGGFIISLVETVNIPFFAPGNFELLFIISALLRAAVFFLFARFFTDARRPERPSLRHLYLYQPVGDILNAFSAATGIVVGRRKKKKDEKE